MTIHPEFDWLFGALFEERLAFEKAHPEVFWSCQIRKFAVKQNVVDYWVRLIRKYREALVNPADAPLKVADELPVTSRDFDASLFDSFAEVCAVVRLRAAGFESFQVLLRDKDKKTPDLRASRWGQPAAVEVKNLRAHDCVELFLPKLFYDRKLKGLDVGGIRLIVGRSFRGTLTEPEKEKLEHVVDRITEFPRDENLLESLSDRASAHFRVVKGKGDAIGMHGISVSDLSTDDSHEGLLRKIADNIRTATCQLYAPVVSDVASRVIAMRWDIPWVKLPISAEPSQVRAIFEKEQRRLGKSTDLLIFSDYDLDLISTLG